MSTHRGFSLKARKVLLDQPPLKEDHDEGKRSETYNKAAQTFRRLLHFGESFRRSDSETSQNSYLSTTSGTSKGTDPTEVSRPRANSATVCTMETNRFTTSSGPPPS
uniref:Uncharacterized protein n=1 Tax=Steinernema glaseri TaxID=37863 RepID=A0A1I8A5T5_9BILA